MSNEEALKLNELYRASVPVHQSSHPKFDSHPSANNTMIHNSMQKPLALGADYLNNIKNIQSSMSSRLESIEYSKGHTEPMNRYPSRGQRNFQRMNINSTQVSNE